MEITRLKIRHHESVCKKDRGKSPLGLERDQGSSNSNKQRASEKKNSRRNDGVLKEKKVIPRREGCVLH